MKPCAAHAEELAMAASRGAVMPSETARHARNCERCREYYERLRVAAELQITAAERLPQPERPANLRRRFLAHQRQPTIPRFRLAPAISTTVALCFGVMLFVLKDVGLGPRTVPHAPPPAATLVEERRLDAGTWAALRSSVYSGNDLVPTTGGAGAAPREHYRVLDAHLWMRDASL